MSKHLLTISTEYVPDWTFVEAVRELFQNALDNEKVNPKNKMSWNYDGVSKLTIGNKHSVLHKKTLLLGNSSKRNDSETIGQHGEGYKVALMVLLREGKSISFYNYANRELWLTRLVKSRNYDNQVVPEINVDKKFVFPKAPSDSLTIEVTGITPDDYELIKKANLNLRDDLNKIETSSGTLLTDVSEKGNMYVGGLYVGHEKDYLYGYDLPVGSVSLDRDRRMVRGYELNIMTSNILKALPDDKMGYLDKAIEYKSADVESLRNRSQWFSTSDLPISKARVVSKGVKERVLEGRKASEVVFVHDNKTLKSAKDQYPEKEAIIVDKLEYDIIKEGSDDDSLTLVEKTSPVDDLKIWFSQVESKLTEEEVKEFNDILEQL